MDELASLEESAREIALERFRIIQPTMCSSSSATFVTFGYNRDGKRGHEQMVIALLCSAEGVRSESKFLPGTLGNLCGQAFPGWEAKLVSTLQASNTTLQNEINSLQTSNTTLHNQLVVVAIQSRAPAWSSPMRR